MSKPFTAVVCGALLLAAGCAPAATTAGASAAPSSAAAAPARTPAAPVVAFKPLAEAPARWWLLDPIADSVPGVGAKRAFRELLAHKRPQRTVVVAIVDSGTDIEHDDLRGVLWRNPNEAPDGRDTDGNGYVDDLHGWSFLGGPAGDVDNDTYELTRLYAGLRSRFGGARADTLAADARAGYDEYQRIRRELDDERAKARQTLQQMRMIDAAFMHATSLLRAHLGTDSLTVPQVARVQGRSELMQARQLFLQLDAHGITETELRRGIEHFERLLEFGYNPDFDPRDLVGDDYANPRERHYGNTNVVGPRADHGTHVAAIAAGVHTALADAAAEPAIRIMPIRAVPNGDERDKDVANAIRYAVDNGAHIINMSFGKAYSPEKDVVDEAVRYADERGVLLVHAAGNDAADLERKQNYPNRVLLDGTRVQHWLEVGASSWKAAVDTIAAPFSNYGRAHVDLFAPGVDIYAAVPGNRRENNSGTSMAAPVVSGVAALLMAYYPELTALQVRQIILESATPLADRRTARPGERAGVTRFGELSKTGGIVNAYAAVLMAEQLTAEPGVN